MVIHNKFVGGNIILNYQENDHIYLNRELRDMDGYHHYWAFCVEGAQGRELTFHVSRLDSWGPAVSHDLVDWSWHDQVLEDGNSFTYRFRENETKVYFAKHILYHPQHFLAFAKKKGLLVTEFCKSRKWNSVPCLQIGEGDISIVLTARHHCNESAGSYVLEGTVDALVKSPIDNTRILVVPFMDYDGVIAGDPGNDRYPHDHNRDYIEQPIYPEVVAMKSYVKQYGCHYGIDFHSPDSNYRTKEKCRCFIHRRCKNDRIDRFSELLLQENAPDAMIYSPEIISSADDKFKEITIEHVPSFDVYMGSLPENIISFSLECSCVGTAQDKATPERLRAFGRNFAEALRKLILEAQQT